MSSAQFGNLIQAEFFTSTHRLSGRVHAGTKPLGDLLNDHSQSYLLVFDVYISRLSEPGEIVAYAPTAFLTKDNLSFVIVPTRQARGPEQGRYASQQYKALVTLPGVEVQGKFAGPYRFDIRTFTPATLDTYQVLFEAEARLVSLPDVTFSGEAILVNRTRVESFCLSE
jgi:hypothetical protein